MASSTTLTKQQKFRGGVWAVAFAAIIMVGTLTGAQLKSDKQKEQVSKFPNPFQPHFGLFNLWRFYTWNCFFCRYSSNISFSPSRSSARLLPANKSPCSRSSEALLSSKGQFCRRSWTSSESASRRGGKNRRIPRNDRAIRGLFLSSKKGNLSRLAMSY